MCFDSSKSSLSSTKLQLASSFWTAKALPDCDLSNWYGMHDPLGQNLCLKIGAEFLDAISLKQNNINRVQGWGCTLYFLYTCTLPGQMVTYFLHSCSAVQLVESSSHFPGSLSIFLENGSRIEIRVAPAISTTCSLAMHTKLYSRSKNKQVTYFAVRPVMPKAAQTSISII